MRDALQADAITSRGRSGDAFTIHVRISMLLARLTIKGEFARRAFDGYSGNHFFLQMY